MLYALVLGVGDLDRAQGVMSLCSTASEALAEEEKARLALVRELLTPASPSRLPAWARWASSSLAHGFPQNK